MSVCYAEPAATFIEKKGRTMTFAVLTCEDSGHKRGEHEKKKREEQAARVVEDFIAIIPDAVI